MSRSDATVPFAKCCDDLADEREQTRAVPQPVQSARGRERLEQKAGIKQGNTGYTMHAWEGARDGMNARIEAGSGSHPFSGLRSVVGAGWGSPRLNEYRLSPFFTHKSLPTGQQRGLGRRNYGSE